MRYLFVILLFTSSHLFAADTTKLYNPYANVEKDVAVLINKAKKENKNILLQIGGNWCISCYRFHNIISTDTIIKNLLSSGYLVYHLNYSTENKNMAYLQKLGNPQRYGFPVLVVLNTEGKQLKTMPGGLLSKGNGYDEEKIKAFLLQWLPKPLQESDIKE